MNLTLVKELSTIDIFTNDFNYKFEIFKVNNLIKT